MALEYRVEFRNQAGEGESALIHTAQDHGVASEYVDRTSREQWEAFKQTHPNATIPNLIEGVFTVNGVTETAIQAYRVWVSRSNAVPWNKIIDDLVDILKVFYGQATAIELKASRIQLAKGTRRRDLKDNRFRFKPFGIRQRVNTCEEDAIFDCTGSTSSEISFL